MHSSCVHEVPTGARIDINRNVYKDGVLINHFSKCNYPSRRREDDRVDRPIQGLPNVLNSTHFFSWLEYDPTSSNNPFGSTWASYLQSSWTVPPAPSVTTGPWYWSLWIGMQNGTYNDDSSATGSRSLLQPVLIYMTPSATYPPQNGQNGPRLPGYSMSSWWVFVSNASIPDDDGAYYSTPYSISSGATVTGYVGALTCPFMPQGVPCDWIVEADSSDGHVSYFTMSSYVPMTRVLGAVFESWEAQSQTSCSHYPNGTNGSTTFSNTIVAVGTSQLVNQVTFNSNNPKWTKHLSPNPPWGSSTTYPSCGNNYGSSVSPGWTSSLTLRY